MSSIVRRWGPTRIAWAVAGLLALALVVTVAVSFSQSDDVDPRRVAVEAYIADVNVIGQGLAAELAAVTKTYSSIADAPTSGGKSVRTLEQAERSVAKLGDRLGTLDPPSEATELHRRILTLARLQSTFARDVTRLARYLIAVRLEAQSLGTATRALSTRLRSSTDVDEQRVAFGRYAGALDDAAAALAAAEVPAALAPIQTAEVARVQRLARLSADLRDALARGDGKEVERLLAEVGRVSRRSLGTIERRSIIAYNSHQKRLGAARLAVEEEHGRLTNELG